MPLVLAAPAKVPSLTPSQPRLPAGALLGADIRGVDEAHRPNRDEVPSVKEWVRQLGERRAWLPRQPLARHPEGE